MRKEVHLGFEAGTGSPVAIPLRHLAVTGQTQEAGKTTTLEALISRSGLRAITFVTKRGEGSFEHAHRIRPYFQERADWQYVASILEASRGERLKFERAWIIRASKGARTLADVQRNVRTAMEKAKGLSADVYLTLDAYLDQVVPTIASVKWAHVLELRHGVNAMDLGALSIEMQHLVIRSTITWVLERERGTVVVVPEAWKFIPQGRGTPVKLAAEAFIRQGAALGNYLWLDSQDLGGIEKAILRSVSVWLLGVQREANEIKRTLDNIPAIPSKPKPAEIATLKLGEFFACWGDRRVRTYVQPAWMEDDKARDVATGALDVHAAAAYGVLSRPSKEADVNLEDFVRRGQSAQAAVYREMERAREKPEMCDQHQVAERALAETRKQLDKMTEQAKAANDRAEAAQRVAERSKELANAATDLRSALARLLPAGAGGSGAPVDEDAIVRRVLAQVPAGGGGPITVTPPEKLRKDFQREESARIVAAARGLDPLQKRVLKLLQTTDGGYVGQPTLNLRLGRTTSGGSMTTMGTAVKGLDALGFVVVKDRAGVANALRDKIAADLGFYQATEAEVEAVYQSVLYELATEGEAAA